MKKKNKNKKITNQLITVKNLALKFISNFGDIV